MTNYFKTNWLFLALLLILPSLSSCDHLPFRERGIVWDEHDPRLHGQVVHFRVPMNYVLLDENHIGDYSREVVAIGRLLKTAKAVSEPGGYAKKGLSFQPVKDGMAFTVKATYWYRENWLNRELAGDIRYIVFADENGIESVALFVNLFYSDRQDLKKLEDEGRYK